MKGKAVEHRVALSRSLCKHVKAFQIGVLCLRCLADNGAEVSRDTGGSLVVLEIMLEADGGMSSIFAPYAHSN